MHPYMEDPFDKAEKLLRAQSRRSPRSESSSGEPSEPSSIAVLRVFVG